MVLSELEILMLLFIGWQASTLYRHWKDAQTIKLIIKEVDAEETQEPISDEVYYIAPDKCTECIGFQWHYKPIIIYIVELRTPSFMLA